MHLTGFIWGYIGIYRVSGREFRVPRIRGASTGGPFFVRSIVAWGSMVGPPILWQLPSWVGSLRVRGVGFRRLSPKPVGFWGLVFDLRGSGLEACGFRVRFRA